MDKLEKGSAGDQRHEVKELCGHCSLISRVGQWRLEQIKVEIDKRVLGGVRIRKVKIFCIAVIRKDFIL